MDTISDAELLYGDRSPHSRQPAHLSRCRRGNFESDLIGCEVVDRRSGESLGTVTAWDDGGGSGLLAVGASLLIPFSPLHLRRNQPRRKTHRR